MLYIVFKEYMEVGLNHANFRYNCLRFLKAYYNDFIIHLLVVDVQQQPLFKVIFALSSHF